MQNNTIFFKKNQDFTEIKTKAENILKTTFGYSSFRHLQWDIIKSVLTGCDTLAIIPTGGGKSMCYQIPALIMNGITVVVSPLISLMQDQVTQLNENGVEAIFLNSSLQWDEYNNAVFKIKNGDAKIVYVSPEGLATSRIKNIFDGLDVFCLTIDEAHCVSEWGHDFRPDYLEIANFRRLFPDAVCLALTATATNQVRLDIAKNLRLKNPNIFVASFNRENIYLEVQPKINADAQVIDCIKKHSGESGIIYCFSRRQVDTLSEKLNRAGFSVLNYHAGLSDEVRAKNQDAFIKDKVQIMVATLAFGMGINKPNVRFVIHYDLPKSIEQYYQEIGRAGRDGLASHALLLYSAGDAHKIEYFLDEASDPEKSELLLHKMMNFSKTKKCRRQFLLGYFGEVMNENAHDEKYCCDNCSRGPVPFTDCTVLSQKFMSCILRTNEHFGKTYIIDVLMGSKQKRIIENGHDLISTYGIGKDTSKENWNVIADALLEAGYIQKMDDYNVLQVTNSGEKLLRERAEIKLQVDLAEYSCDKSATQTKKSPQSFVLHKKGAFSKTLNDEYLALYNKLKAWRKKQADEANVPPYVIFGDKTIEDLVSKKPQTESDLLEIYGFGRIKTEKFGSQVLRIIRE